MMHWRLYFLLGKVAEDVESWEYLHEIEEANFKHKHGYMSKI